MHLYRCSLVVEHSTVVTPAEDDNYRPIKDFYVEARTIKEAKSKAMHYLSSRISNLQERLQSQHRIFIGKEIDTSQIIH